MIDTIHKCVVVGAMMAVCPSTEATAADDAAYLLGDWDGARTHLEDEGIALQFDYVGEAAHNFSGGTRSLTRYTDQWRFGAGLDLDKLWGWRGSYFQITFTQRNGRDLGADANIGNNQLIQEVFGRGQTLHLTEFWFDRKWFDGRLDWKIGRLTVGGDFASFSCDFQNLTFCGAQPSNIVGDYWVNWPTSQWATRIKLVTSEQTYVQIGAYQVNPTFIDDAFARRNGWKLNNPDGTLGALIPLEFGWTPAPRGLVGSYKLGLWYSTAEGDDVFEDVNREPIVLTGGDALQHDSRYGGYLNFQQQVSGAADAQGTMLFLNITQADRETSTTDRQISLGVEYKGVFDRPRDMIGFAIGTTHVNSRVARGQRLRNSNSPADAAIAVQDSEYVGEFFYSWSPLPSLQLRPNLQYIVHPGGSDTNHDAFVLGLKSVMVF